jgi:hypothetical protein
MSDMIVCKRCSASIHWLDEFPGGICINCHAKAVDAMTPQQLKRQITAAFNDAEIINRETTRPEDNA